MLYLKASRGRIEYGVLIRHDEALINSHLRALEKAVGDYAPFLLHWDDPDLTGVRSFGHAVDIESVIVKYRLRQAMFNWAKANGPWAAIKHLRPRVVDQWNIKKGSCVTWLVPHSRPQELWMR